jgi:transcriptional regulator with XRE-family HTH domain
MRGVDKQEETFGQHLAMLRNRSKKSQEEVAILTGIAEWLIDRYEKYERVPKRGDTHKIARAIGCDAFWLLKWRDDALAKKHR